MYDDHVTFFKDFPGSTSRPNFGKLGNSKNPFSMHHPIRLFDLFGRYEPSRILRNGGRYFGCPTERVRQTPPSPKNHRWGSVHNFHLWRVDKVWFLRFPAVFFLGGFDSLNKKITQAWLWNRCLGEKDESRAVQISYVGIRTWIDSSSLVTFVKLKSSLFQRFLNLKGMWR